MKYLKKRGISPLIATVLLIGFTITVAAVLMTWAGDYVKEKAEKEGLKGEAQAECATSVELKLKSLECQSDKVTAIIENTGSVNIDHTRFRINGASDPETIGPLEGILQHSQKEIQGGHSVTRPESVQIFPIIVKTQEGKSLPLTCSEKMIEAKC